MNNVEALKALIEVAEKRGQKQELIEGRTGFGSTVLLNAARFGSHECVALLLKEGADPDAYNDFDDGALMLVAGSRSARRETLDLLLHEKAQGGGGLDVNRQSKWEKFSVVAQLLCIYCCSAKFFGFSSPLVQTGSRPQTPLLNAENI